MPRLICDVITPPGPLNNYKLQCRYDAAAEAWPQYLLGQAYLTLKPGTEAAREFQKILSSAPFIFRALVGISTAALTV